jgi:hypothetical protein
VEPTLTSVKMAVVVCLGIQLSFFEEKKEAVVRGIVFRMKSSNRAKNHQEFSVAITRITRRSEEKKVIKEFLNSLLSKRSGRLFSGMGSFFTHKKWGKQMYNVSSLVGEEVQKKVTILRDIGIGCCQYFMLLPCLIVIIIIVPGRTSRSNFKRSSTVDC